MRAAERGGVGFAALAGLPQNRSFALSLSLYSHVFNLMLWLLVLADILYTLQHEVCEDFE